MKRLYVLLMCVAAAILLIGCSSDDAENSKIETGERIYETYDVSEHDENGDIILTSTEYRQVYMTDPGTYLVVVFSGSGPSSIQIVKDFGTQSAAVEYITTGGKTLIDSGDYTSLNLNGKYVTYSPTLNNEKYGMYYGMSKSQAEAELSSTYVKQ